MKKSHSIIIPPYFNVNIGYILPWEVTQQLSNQKCLGAKHNTVLTWYIRTTIIGSSAKTFRDKDPLGIIECWKENTCFINSLLIFKSARNAFLKKLLILMDTLTEDLRGTKPLGNHIK